MYLLLFAGQNVEMLTGVQGAILDYEVNVGMGAMFFRAKIEKDQDRRSLVLDTMDHHSSSLGLLS